MIQFCSAAPRFSSLRFARFVGMIMGGIAFCLLALPSLSYAQEFGSLHSFGSSPSDGRRPTGGLLLASDGYFYGTTYVGGDHSFGTLFRIHPDGSDYSVLHQFTNGDDGSNPSETLVQAGDGNIYGTATQGGTSHTGTFFRLTTGGVFTILYNFAQPDGIYPDGGLVEATDGYLYGIATNGGTHGLGTIFRISTSGSLTTLHNFSFSDGTPLYGLSSGRLIQASDGKLYGTTLSGGIGGYGTIFRLTTTGAFTVIHDFQFTDGAFPNGSLIEASDKRLYGTTRGGGANEFYGTVFRMSTDGHLFTVLHDFNSDEEYEPLGGLIQASDGDLYGSTFAGGIYQQGTIYRITRAGVFSNLYSFNNSDGANPVGSLLQIGDGSVYGTTMTGGTDTYGTIFTLPIINLPGITEISPHSTEAGHDTFNLTVYGSDFLPNATVVWNGIPLSTHYSSSNRVRATVPASLVANAGTAKVMVTNGGQKSYSTSIFTIHVTVLKIVSASVTKDSSGNYTVNFTLKNVGSVATPNTNLISASLGDATTDTTLPISLGTVAPGATVSKTLVFPSYAGTSGSVVTLSERCTFTGGGTNSIFQVTLP